VGNGPRIQLHRQREDVFYSRCGFGAALQVKLEGSAAALCVCGWYRRIFSPGRVGMWALVRNVYIKFWEGRFIHTKIDLPVELMANLKTGKWKIYLEDNGIVISGEADYMKAAAEVVTVPVPKRKGRV
jgi:hypothetical protein